MYLNIICKYVTENYYIELLNLFIKEIKEIDVQENIKNTDEFATKLLENFFQKFLEFISNYDDNFLTSLLHKVIKSDFFNNFNLIMFTYYIFLKIYLKL